MKRALLTLLIVASAFAQETARRIAIPAKQPLTHETMWLMKRVGANAIPAPTGQLTGRPMHWNSWIPSAAGLGRSERALHEYMALAALTAHVSD